ncbi:MAG TPA: hypothetical protein VGA69_12900 [Nitriliruptorales bacterium]
MSAQVGFGRGLITPELPVVLAGFGARKGAVHEVRHDLEAHALVVRDGGQTLCLLVLDLLMLAPDHADPVRAAVSAALGIPASQVLTSCTHTHSGPSAAAGTRRAGWPPPDGYLERLTAGCVDAATTAQAGAEPAAFAYARAPLPEGLSLNRRDLPYDPEFAVLEVRRPDGSRIGTVTNVGIHPVALGITCRAVSGDWVTTFRERSQKATGAPSILLPGALGDVNPGRDPHTHPDPAGNWDTAEELGADVASAVDDLLPEVQPSGDRAGVVARREVTLRAGVTLASVLGGVALRPVEVELFEWDLGGIRLVSVPGEAFHALGRAMERARGDRTLLAGLAPVWHGYLPAPFRSGYEETMSYGRGFVHPLRELLVTPPEPQARL